MSYRDESDALRARIAMLEARLQEKSIGLELQTAKLHGRSFLAQRVSRYSVTLDGWVSREGVDAIGQLLWMEVGGADDGVSLDDAPPGKSVFTHAQGKRVFRVVESSCKTHLSVDHHYWGFARSFGAIIAVAGALGLFMLTAGVHDDWNQMFMAIYVVAVVLLGPLAYSRGRAQETQSVTALKNAAEVAREHIVLGSERPSPRRLAHGAAEHT